MKKVVCAECGHHLMDFKHDKPQTFISTEDFSEVKGGINIGSPGDKIEDCPKCGEPIGSFEFQISHILAFRRRYPGY